MDRLTLVAANWKMNGQRAQIVKLMQDLKVGLDNLSELEVAICPPSVYLDLLQAIINGSQLHLGAQNLFTEDHGAFTGEISAPMLKDFGCRYVLVGHSERKIHFGETDAVIAAKFAAAQKHGLMPILCVGESDEQRKAGLSELVVSAQLTTVIKHVGVEAFGGAVIAYEPVWAIGTGFTAKPEQAQTMHKMIRSLIAEYDVKVAANLRIIYGGSVSGANATELSMQVDIDGALVGGASLVAKQFVEICTAMNSNKKLRTNIDNKLSSKTD